ncbi:thioesterase domain-containing protein [Vibrio sp. PP-XX7]
MVPSSHHTSIHTSNDQRQNPIRLVQGSHQDTLFFFHASDGDPSVYLPLAKALDRQAFGLHAGNPGSITSLSALAESYTAAIRRQQPQGPYTLVGWSYGAFTAASAAVQLKHAGQTVRLICLDPVCREDFRFADRTALLHLLAGGPVDLSLSERLADMNETEQMQHFIGQAQAAGMIPSTYSDQQAQVWLERTEHLLRLLADHPQPAAVDIPCLQIHAVNRPEHWHSAGHDWSSWHPYSEHRQLHTTHWGLVTDPHWAQQCAREISQWLFANHLSSEENEV